MDIINLSINNFLTIGSSGNLNLKNRGLVLIQGENLEDSSSISNGAGKSTITDALCWALYGVTAVARGASGDGVVNIKAKKDCKVVVTLQDGESIYEVARHRKHKTFKNQTTITVWNPASGYPADPGLSIAKGTEKETQEEIERIVGCSFEVFCAAIYAGQESMPDLPGMTDKQLKMVIEQAAGVERLEKAYEIARARHLAAEAALSRVTTALNTLTGRLTSAQEQATSMQQKASLFEAGRVQRKAEYQNNAATLAEGMRQRHAEFMQIDGDALIAELQGHQKSLSEHTEKVKELDKWVRLAEEAQKRQMQHQAQANIQIAEIKRIKAQIENAKEMLGKPCGECGKPHTEDELESFTSVQRAKLEIAVAAFKQAMADGEVVNETCAKAKALLEEHKAAIPNVSDISNRCYQINETLRQRDAIKAGIQRLRAAYDAENAKADGVMTEANPHASAVQMINENVAKIEADTKALQNELSVLEQDCAVKDSVVKVFGPAGVRAHILDTVTPFLNDRTADYLNAISDGNIQAIWSTLGETAKGDVREKFHIEAQKTSCSDGFGGLSGGEKRKVRIACMLALQDLVSSRATKPINLWIGDEIDDALDAAGLERLMGILERKARERGTVLIISHNELTDWVDQIATVTRQNGSSTVSGALSS